MSATGDTVDLTLLDALRPATLDGEIRQRNHAALAETHPQLAARLADFELPSHYRPALALDGAMNWRIEAGGEAPRWLGGSAIPQRRAEALLRDYDRGNFNATLPALASGVELASLLERLPQHVAVFVFEQDLSVIAAVLRIRPLDCALREHRCHIVSTADDRAHLVELLERYPGLLPPGNILRLPNLSAKHLDRVREICEAVNAAVLTSRARRMEDLRAKVSPAPGAGERLALVALTPDARVHRLTAELERAAHAIGWEATRAVLDSPLDGHVLSACELLSNFAPTMTINIGSAHAQIPYAARGARFVWHLRRDDIPAELGPGDDIHLAASPMIEQALRRAGAGDESLHSFYWACGDSGLAHQSSAKEAGALMLVGDLPNDSEAACGIEQPTHKLLWKQLRQTVEQRWERADVREPETLLATASRTSGIRLGEESLRSGFLRLIEFVLVPAVTLRRISDVLTRQADAVWVVGRGWGPQASAKLRVLSDCLSTALNLQPAAEPGLVAFPSLPDPLSGELLEAAARGWRIAMHTPGGRLRRESLGGVFDPRQDFDTFAGAKDLRALCASRAARPSVLAQRLTRVAEHVRETHSWTCRLLMLRELRAKRGRIQP